MAGHRVLVCDDEPHIVHVVAMKLRNAGYEVATAADGEEGFETAKTFKPDLVMTDYQMPYLSGLELCAKLRGDAMTASIPVIMLTARGFSLDAEEMKNSNIRKILPKPFSPREVLASVQEILNRQPCAPNA